MQLRTRRVSRGDVGFSLLLNRQQGEHRDQLFWLDRFWDVVLDAGAENARSILGRRQ
jgi:hypothetical protein